MELIKVGIVDNDVDMNMTLLNSNKPGYFIELTQTICDQLGYDCQFEVAPTSHYGDFKNGSWTGFLALLQNGLYDTAIPTFTPTYQRSMDFDFTQFTMRYSMVILMKNDFGTDISHKFTAFLKPFNFEIWLSVLLALLTITIITFLLKYEFHSHLKSVLFEFTGVLLSNALYLIRRSFIVKVNKNIFSNRLLILTWGFSSIFILCFYVSRLHAVLLTTHRRLPVWDFESILNCLESTECKLVVRPGDDIYEEDFTHVEAASEEVHLRKVLKQVGVIKVNNSDEALNLVEKSNSRLILLTYPYEPIKKTKGDCSIMKIESDMYDFSSFPFKKGDLRKPQFDRVLYDLHSSGVVKALFAKYFPHSNRCFHIGSKKVISETLNMSSFQISAFSGAFAALLVGLAAGLIVLLLERKK